MTSSPSIITPTITSTPTIITTPTLTSTPTTTAITATTGNTLSSVETRSQQVLANADRLLHGARLNPATHPSGNTPPSQKTALPNKTTTATTTFKMNLLDQFIAETVQLRLFTTREEQPWPCHRFGHMMVNSGTCTKQTNALTPLERLEQNLGHLRL